MKISAIKLFHTSSILGVLILTHGSHSNAVFGQTSTPGELSFTVRTVTDNGNFAPRHVLAIWIEDANGFVITRKLSGNKRKEYLYTWNSNTSGNTVDATTGATLSSHQTHTVTWDCKDISGSTVPDGQYAVYVEFTEEHSQGPLETVSFTKGTEAIHLTPADKSRFKDIDLQYTPTIVSASFTYSISGLTVEFSNTSANASMYLWDFGDGSSSAEENPTHTFTSDGDYTVSLTASKGSDNDIEEKLVSVSASGLIAGFTYTANYLSLSFTNTSVGAETYSWDFGDGGISTEANPVHVFSVAGTYSVVLTAVSGSFSDTFEGDILVENDLTSVEKNRFDDVLAYPNPFSGVLRIDLSEEPEVSSIKIYNILGKQVYSSRYNESGIMEIELKEIPRGIYLLHLDGSKGTRIQKIMKQ